MRPAGERICILLFQQQLQNPTERLRQLDEDPQGSRRKHVVARAG